MFGWGAELTEFEGVSQTQTDGRVAGVYFRYILQKRGTIE